MIAHRVRPLPEGFALVVAASGLRLSVVSGPVAAPVGTAGDIAYLVELRHGDDRELAIRFPYTPAIAPGAASEITLDDVLFAVAGDISATHRADADSPDAPSTLWVPAERITDVAHALERAIGPWRYRVLLAAYQAEERDWLTGLAVGFARPKGPPPSAGRRRSRRDHFSQPSSARPTNPLPALADAWNAVRQASDDAERANGYVRTGEAFLALGLSEAAADAFRGALRAAKSADNTALESRALIGQMAVAAATGREALFERFRRAIPARLLPPAVAAHYRATAEDGCRRFGRATGSAANPERPHFATGSVADTSIVQAATERAIQSLSAPAGPICIHNGRRSAAPVVTAIVRRLRATARLDRARSCGRAAAALTSRLSRGLAEASAAATRERLEHPRYTSVDPDTTSNRWRGAPAELELTLHAAQYASAVRAALAAGDIAWGGTAWLLGALEAAQHFGYALADSGAPAAADAWFLDLEQATVDVAPEFAAHVLTWRAGMARRAGRWAESDRLAQFAERHAALVNDSLLSLAVGKARAQAILAVGNLGDAEVAFRDLLARAKCGTIGSSALTVALLNDLAITLERRADATADPVLRTERLIEAAHLVAEALTFGPGVLRPGQRELLVHNLGAFCVALGYIDTADRAFEAILRSLPSGSFRATAIVAGALSGRVDLAVRRGDGASFARGVAKAAARWMEPRQRGIVLLATLRGWQRFGTPADVDRARADLEAHARAYRLNDLLTFVEERGPIEGVPATGDATGFSGTTRKGEGFDKAIATAVVALSTAPDPARVTPGFASAVGNPWIRHSSYQVLWSLTAQTAPLFAMPTASEGLRDAPDRIRAALAESSPSGRREPLADPSLLAAIRAYGDALGSLQAYREARIWLSAAIRAGTAAHDAGLVGWALAWRATKRRQGIQAGHGESACRAAVRDYRASLELASIASLGDLALFARHGLAGVAPHPRTRRSTRSRP